MMLFKLSLKNIIKSLKDYAIYFFTLVLGVAIFYVFNAIESQTVMMNVSKSTYEIIKLMTSMLSGVSVFVAFILGFLIIYASRFLIKRRNKEFGIYLTLGMSKRKISLILFVETLIIGILSLIVGLGVGFFLSQLMSLLVANMFDADMTNFTFVFSSSAFIKTLVYFSIMYLIVMIFNTIIISKCKLIDLFYGNKKSEKVKLKNPWACISIFIIAVLMLSYAYYLVIGKFETLDESKILIPIILGCVSTFLLFWSLSGLILKIVMSFKKMYYKGLNSFILRQVSSKINTTIFQITIICLMLFVTICVLSSALTLKNSLSSSLNELSPSDIQLSKKVNLDSTWLNEGYNEEQIKNSNLGVIDTLEKFDFNLKNNLKEYVEINIYNTPDLTLNNTLGDMLNQIRDKYRFLRYDTQEDIIKISDYNKVARLYGNKEYHIKDDEYIIVADFDSMIEVRNIALENEENINVFNTTLKPKYKKCQDGFVEMSANHINSGIIIVPDRVVDNVSASVNMIIGNYNTTNKKEKLKIENRLNELIENKKANYYILPSGNTKLAIAEAAGGLGALVTFIGLYLGIIFLISSAAILALKELSESSDNKERFRMLRKIGADEKLINRALFKQIAIFFITPLILAIIHSVFGIMFCNKILEVVGNEKLLPSIIMTATFLVIIYGGYFLITYFCSKNIIKEK